MRAREPDYEGLVERDGVRVGYDVYGAGEPAILLLTSGRSCTPGSGRLRCRTYPGDSVRPGRWTVRPAVIACPL
jgi:hypothetical protein